MCSSRPEGKEVSIFISWKTDFEEKNQNGIKYVLMDTTMCTFSVLVLFYNRSCLKSAGMWHG